MSQIEMSVSRVKELRAQGLSRAKIVEVTGYPERFVRTHMQGVEKVVENSKTKQAVQVLLSLGRIEIKQHELNDAVYNVYGNKWDGFNWVANWDKNTVHRVKTELLTVQPSTIIVPNWVDLTAPTESREMLEVMATELQSLLSEMTAYYVTMHGTPDETKDAQQLASNAREHILSLAFGKYSPEPIAKLLARTKEVTDVLEYGESRPHVTPEQSTGKREAVDERSIVIVDAFLDECERLSELNVTITCAPAWTTEQID